MTPSRQLGDRQQHSRGLQRLEAVARVRHDEQVTGPTIQDCSPADNRTRPRKTCTFDGRADLLPSRRRS
jgi:hypothetical protein